MNVIIQANQPTTEITQATPQTIIAKLPNIGGAKGADSTVPGPASEVPGPAGLGISSFALTGTVGPVKTYRLTFTNETFVDVSITDGVDGEAPVITWNGTVIVVDGVEGPDLKGADGTTYTDEMAQDAVAAAIAAGTHSGINITYNAETNEFTFTVTTSTTYAERIAEELALTPRKLYWVYGDSTDGGTTPNAATQASIDVYLSAGVPAANIRWLYTIEPGLLAIADVTSGSTVGAITISQHRDLLTIADLTVASSIGGIVLIGYPKAIVDNTLLANGFTANVAGSLATITETAAGVYRLKDSDNTHTIAGVANGIACLLKSRPAAPYTFDAVINCGGPNFTADSSTSFPGVLVIFDSTATLPVTASGQANAQCYTKRKLQLYVQTSNSSNFGKLFLLYMDTSGNDYDWNGTSWVLGGSTGFRLSAIAGFKATITRNANNTYTVTVKTADGVTTLTTVTTPTTQFATGSDIISIGDSVGDPAVPYIWNQDIVVSAISVT
jgi:hypothetical protein